MRFPSILLTSAALSVCYHATLAGAKTFSLPDGDIDAADLPGLWFNHQECYLKDEYYNTTILLDQDNDLVPTGAIFLDYHDCGSVERKATIPKSTKLVLLPIFGDSWFDIDDDGSSTMEDCPARGSLLFAEQVEESKAFIQNMSNYAKEPFATVNGEPLEPYWVSSDKEFYFKACPIEPDKEICDECDINFQPPEGCDSFAGTDVYPSYALIATDDREWKSGETRTYNYGFTLLEDGETGYCTEATYTLMADSGAPTTRGKVYGFSIAFLLLSLWVM
jgi:hypothetical protein